MVEGKSVSIREIRVRKFSSARNNPVVLKFEECKVKYGSPN